LAARILRVADSYVALTDARPFRPAFSVADARREIADHAGIEFDPAVVSAFLALEHMPELESYAKDSDALPVVEKKNNDKWDMFSSFMR
jgi:two-component system response regulator RpfG